MIYGGIMMSSRLKLRHDELAIETEKQLARQATLALHLL